MLYDPIHEEVKLESSTEIISSNFHFYHVQLPSRLLFNILE